MKIACAILLILTAVLAGGCMTTAPGAVIPAAPPDTPDLVGTWTGPMQGYDQGFTDNPGLTMAMNITGQQGRIFAGYLTFRSNGTESRTGIAGAIGRDNRTFTITEEGGGYSFGEVLSEDALEMTYVQDGPDYSIAIDSLTRVQKPPR